MRRVSRSAGRLVATIAGLTLAGFGADGWNARFLRVGVNGHETTVRSVARVPDLSRRFGVTILLDEFPVDENARPFVVSGGERAAVGGAIAGVRPGLRTAPADVTVRAMRIFREARDVALWVARSENDIDSMLECRKARVWGADLGGGAALHIECGDGTVRDAGGQSLWERWVPDAVGVPRGPAMVRFETNGYSISAETIQLLERYFEMLRRQSDLEALIAGGADAGEQEPALLAQRRADALRRFLTERGIAAERLHAVSYGTERPFEASVDPAGWSHNRVAVIMTLGRAGADR